MGDVQAITRRELNANDSKLHAIVEPDNSEWPTKFTAIQPPPSILFSALGTTRANAGGLDKQWAFDHDFALEMAKAAKAAGVKVFVLISASGAAKTSKFAYPRMKGSLEEEVRGLDFEQTIILRPGLIVGPRQESRPTEAAFRTVANIFGRISHSLKDVWAQDADVIGKAAVSAGLSALEGKAPGKVWIIGQSDIIRLGRTEWKA